MTLAKNQSSAIWIVVHHFQTELKTTLDKRSVKGNRITEDLFDTKFAAEELGLCYPESPDDLREMGEYFLGLYALDRAYAEEDGKEYSEDLFYAGVNLRRAADVIEDEEIDFDKET